tara:strand:+ start:244 stop:453 length:210 start_codon:yes stop_codon:yes gene_type:complete
MTRSESLKRAQRNYEQRKKEENPEQYKADKAKYMREYRLKKKLEKEDVKNKLFRIEELKKQILEIESTL